jgi:diaminopimelate decarboxylase
MLLPITSSIDENGVLNIGGVSMEELRSKYRTPLYIVDIETVKRQCSDYLRFFDFAEYQSEIIYASKAFCTVPMCQLMEKEGLSIDVSNGGELYIALKAGFKPKKIYFHGNNKAWEEINFGMEKSVGTFVVDNFSELEMINSLAMQKNITQQIMLRITPGIKANTHEYIQTGAEKSKFGFGIKGDVALEAVKRADEFENVNLSGFHAHIGSQIFNIEVYDRLIDRLVSLIRDVRDKTGVEIRQLNIGGGLGIKYTREDRPAGIEDLAEVVHSALNKYTAKHDVRIDRICLEPGRSIIGSAGVTLYEVGNIKEIPGIKNYMAIDGGMSDNIRPLLYQAEYEAFIASNAAYLGEIDDGEPAGTAIKPAGSSGESGKNTKKYDIVGKHCESGDVIIKDAVLPDSVNPGDLICVAATGAYCYSMSSNYNGQPKNAIAAVENEKSWLWVERQTYRDLVSKDRRLYK